MWYRYRCDDALHYETAEKVLAIPGVSLRGRVVHVEANAAWLVEDILNAGEVKFEVDRPIEPEPIKSIHDLVPNGLQPWVPDFLTDYQREGVINLSNKNGYFIWAAGSGKSLGSICWAMVHPRKTLVVTRAPVRRSFGREIERFTNKRAFVVEGTTPIDFTQLAEEFMFVVVSHQILPDHYKEIVRWRPHNLILDELHHLSSHKRWTGTVQQDGKTKFSQLDNIASAAMEISRVASRRLGLSATPVRNIVKNLWAQLDLIEPMAWGPYYKQDRASFAGRYCDAHPGLYGGIDDKGAKNLDELWDRVSIISDQVSYATTHRGLPPKRRLVTFVPVADQVRATGFQKDFKAAAKAGGTAILEMKLMEAAARKRKYIKEVVRDALESGQKVVVFTGRRADCDTLGEEIGAIAKDTDAKIWVGHGGHSSAERDQMMKSYMAAPAPAILVGTGDAWGEGMNLQDTDLHLIAMLPYTPGQVIQWEGRCARLGQKRPVMIQYLIAEGTVDEHVADILIRKLPAVEDMVGDESVEGFAGQLAGSDHEDDILDSIMGLMSSKDVGEDD